MESIKQTTRNKFNISISEVDHEDVWTRSSIAVVTVNSSRKRIDKLFSLVKKLLRNNRKVNLTETKMEIL